MAVRGQWELLATRSGGTVTSLVTTGQQVLAATPAGLRRSTDNGRSWTVIGGALLASVELVAPSPAFASDATVLVGTSDGLVRSTDGGATWQPALVGSRVLAIAYSPTFVKDRLVLVGTEDDGVLRSIDGGRTWTGANPGLLDLTVLGLACSPAFEVDHTAFAATASGLFRSSNEGRAWRAIETVPGEPAVQCVAVSPEFATHPVVLAGTEADGLLWSTDAGRTWGTVSALAGRSVTALAWTSTTRLAAALDTGLMASDDAGATWWRVGAEIGPVLSLAFAPDGALLGGVPRSGVVRSNDLASWQVANAGLQANLVVALTLSPAFARDQTLYAAGLEDGMLISTDAGASWATANGGLGADAAVFGLAAGPQGIYAATSAGIFRRTANAGNWERVCSVAARAVHVQGQRVVGTGLQDALVASSDGGGTWQTLTWPTASGQPKSAAILGPRALLVGSTLSETSETAVWQSSTDGQDWRRVLLERGRDPGAAPLAVASPSAVFVGVGDEVLRLVDSEWRRSSLPGVVSGLEASPAYRHDRTVVAGTSAGVCISRDAGASFAATSAGMGDVHIVAVAFSPAYAEDRLVYAVELGGRIWRLRDP